MGGGGGNTGHGTIYIHWDVSNPRIMDPGK